MQPARLEVHTHICYIRTHILCCMQTSMHISCVRTCQSRIPMTNSFIKCFCQRTVCVRLAMLNFVAANFRGVFGAQCKGCAHVTHFIPNVCVHVWFVRRAAATATASATAASKSCLRQTYSHTHNTNIELDKFASIVCESCVEFTFTPAFKTGGNIYTCRPHFDMHPDMPGN